MQVRLHPLPSWTDLDPAPNPEVQAPLCKCVCVSLCVRVTAHPCGAWKPTTLTFQQEMRGQG